MLCKCPHERKVCENKWTGQGEMLSLNYHLTLRNTSVMAVFPWLGKNVSTVARSIESCLSFHNSSTRFYVFFASSLLTKCVSKWEKKKKKKTLSLRTAGRAPVFSLPCTPHYTQDIRSYIHAAIRMVAPRTGPTFIVSVLHLCSDRPPFSEPSDRTPTPHQGSPVCVDLGPAGSRACWEALLGHCLGFPSPHSKHSRISWNCFASIPGPHMQTGRQGFHGVGQKRVPGGAREISPTGRLLTPRWQYVPQL